jgi:hypothetical protein
MAGDNGTWKPQEAWRRFRLEAEAARNDPSCYALYSDQTHRDPLLEALLPTLLYIKAVAILDDALDVWLEQNGHQLRPPYRDDLNGRLDYLGDNRLLQDVDAVHAVRRERNRLAHEPGTSCDWRRLGDEISVVETALLSLGLVRPTPQLDYFCERSAIEGSNEPGVSFSRRFSYGVKENGKPALEVAGSERQRPFTNCPLLCGRRRVARSWS